MGVVGMITRMVLYLLNLGENILKVLIANINSEQRTAKSHISARDLSIVFKFIDKDQSGSLSPGEIVAAFKRYGLHCSDQELEQLKHAISEQCGQDVTRE